MEVGFEDVSFEEVAFAEVGSVKISLVEMDLVEVTFVLIAFIEEAPVVMSVVVVDSPHSFASARRGRARKTRSNRVETQTNMFHWYGCWKVTREYAVLSWRYLVDWKVQ